MDKTTEPPKKTEITPSSRELADPIDRLFEEFRARNWLTPLSTIWPERYANREWMSHRLPRMDLVDQGDTLMVRAQVPGVDKENIDISITDHSLSIKGHTRKESEDKQADYYRREIYQGEFSRTISLPCEVDSNTVKARLRDGNLEITMSKIKTPQAKKVKIS